MMVIKAQSQIVSTVILILIVISLGIVILNFTFGFVKDKLTETGCFEVVNQVEFTNSVSYTCFDGTNDVVNLQVHVGDVNESIAGFLIEIGGASTETYEIRDGDTKNDGVSMFGLTDNDPLEVPGRNEERTFVIDVPNPESVKIYPLLNNGQTCDSSSEINRLSLCR